jgi:hypothetical protein
MEYRGQLSEEDLVRGFCVHIRKKFRREIWIWGSVSVSILVLQLFVPEPNPLFIGIACVVPGTLIYYRYVRIPQVMRREFRQNPQYGKPFHTAITDEGFETWHGSDNQKRSWTDFKSWRENDEYILLYESDLLYRMLPKRVFQNGIELEQFRDLLKRRIGTPR